MKPGRILLLNRWFHPEVFGGTESSLWGLATALRELDCDVTVFCESRAQPLGWQDVEGFRVYRHDRAPPPLLHWSLRSLSNYRHIIRSLRRVQHELEGQPIICRTYWYAAAARVVFPEAPIFFWCPGTGRLFEASERDSLTGRARAWATFEMWLARIIERRALRGATLAVAESGHVRDDLVRAYRVPAPKTRVWQNGIDTERFRPRPRDEELCRELNLPANAPVVLSVCRFAPMKNLDFLVRAFARLARRDAFLVLLGDGPERDKLERLAASLQVGERVRFPGFRQDVERFYALASVFTLPSVYEPYGNAFSEALACGIPTLGLRPGPGVLVPTDEHVVHGENGFLIDAKDEGDLTRRLDMLLGDEPLRQRMAETARELAVQRYDWRRTAGAFLAELDLALPSAWQELLR